MESELWEEVEEWSIGLAVSGIAQPNPSVLARLLLVTRSHRDAQLSPGLNPVLCYPHDGVLRSPRMASVDWAFCPIWKYAACSCSRIARRWHAS